MSIRSCVVLLLALLLAPMAAPAREPECRYGCQDHHCKHERLWEAHHFYLEGRALARRGYLVAATDVLEHACDLAPAEGRYQLLLGKVLRENGDPKGAVMHLRMAMETGDESVEEQASQLLEALGAAPTPEAKTAPVEASAKAPKTPKAKAPAKPKVEKPDGAKSAGKSLYEKLGGHDAIQEVVGEFVARVGADKRINSFFATADLEGLKKNLVDQIGQAAGGPEVYKGRSMKEAHKGLGVKAVHFDALVEDLVAVLDKFKVPEKEKSALLAVLGPMKADIVE